MQDEAEVLKTRLQVFEHAENVQEEGSVTIAEQIAGQVEEIRQELMARHEGRVKQEEEKYNKRVQSMKTSLNKQLSTVRVESQKRVDDAVTQALQSLKEEHVLEILALNTRHSEELAELQYHIKSAESGAVKRPSDADEDNREAREQASDRKWEPGENDVRELLLHNQFARKQVMNSINNRERKVREEEQKILVEQVAKVREEEQKKFADQSKEVETKISKAKQDAEIMVEKRFAVKFTMTDNRMRAVQAKIDVVQKAAAETPDEAVSKVWAVAKDAKPTPPVAKPATQATTSIGGPSSQVQTPASLSLNGTQQNPFAAGAKANPFGQSASVQPQQGSTHTAFGQPSQNTPQVAATPSTAMTDTTNTQSQTGSHIPTKAIPSLQQSSHAPGGRGPPSALPRGGAMVRGRSGSGIPRGGARGGLGRGAVHAVNTTLAANAQQSQDSPKTAKGMNPVAQQFVPGQKRGLDASEHAGGDEKRRKSETS